MTEVIICDDDHFTPKWIVEIINEAIKQYDIEAEIACVSDNAKETAAYAERNEGHFLFFLDIDLGKGEINGIDLARHIREKHTDSKIVFLTSHSEKCMNVINAGVEPFGFIEKDSSKRRMVREAASVMKRAEQKNRIEVDVSEVELPIGIDEYISFSVNRILYVETLKNIPHNICCHTVDGSTVIVRDTLTHAKELLGQDFELCHRAFLVNRRQVIYLEGSELKLSTGEKIPVALGRKKYFAEGALQSYD